MIYFKRVYFNNFSISDRPAQRRVLTLMSVMFGLLYSVQLLIPEHFIQNPLSSPAEYLRGLLAKYFVGSLDLILTPVIVTLTDSEIREGINFLYRRKRERPGTGYLR